MRKQTLWLMGKSILGGGNSECKGPGVSSHQGTPGRQRRRGRMVGGKVEVSQSHMETQSELGTGPITPSRVVHMGAGASQGSRIWNEAGRMSETCLVNRLGICLSISIRRLKTTWALGSETSTQHASAAAGDWLGPLWLVYLPRHLLFFTSAERAHHLLPTCGFPHSLLLPGLHCIHQAHPQCLAQGRSLLSKWMSLAFSYLSVYPSIHPSSPFFQNKNVK